MLITQIFCSTKSEIKKYKLEFVKKKSTVQLSTHEDTHNPSDFTTSL